MKYVLTICVVAAFVPVAVADEEIDMMQMEQMLSRPINHTDLNAAAEEQEITAARNAEIASGKKSRQWIMITGWISVIGLSIILGVPAIFIFCAIGYSYYEDWIKRRNNRPVKKLTLLLA